jgi:hypothetical protein
LQKLWYNELGKYLCLPNKNRHIRVTAKKKKVNAVDGNYECALALAYCKIAELRAECVHHEMVKEAKRGRVNWFKRQPKPSEQEEARSEIRAGYNAKLRSI